MTVRIAIDARPLSIKITGIGRYLQQLLDKLLPMTQDNVHWYLYSDQALPFNTDYKHITLRHGNAKGGSLAGYLFAQYKFPIWSKQDNIDVFWSPRHHLPVNLPKSMNKVLTIHDLVWKEHPDTMPATRYWLERLLMPPSLRSAQDILCSSQATRETLIHYYPSTDSKSHITHCAATHKSKTPDNPPERDSYFLFVGTQEPRKNLDRLITAYAAVVSNGHCKQNLVIIGDIGWGSQDTLTRVKQLNIESHVKIKGYVSDDDLQAYYYYADALLMPSIYEGFGLPLLEAMQHGIPVVASNCSSMPEIVGDGGLLVDPYDIEQITLAIRQLSENTDERYRMGKKAQEQCRQFTWERSAIATLRVLLKHHPISETLDNVHKR